VPPKKKYGSDERGAELTELLDTLESLLERTKILYEQYFMGIQKIPPSQLHKDIERKIRELTQEQIRNTALRFRLNTVTQKFGSYNTYWKRTLQAIEQGRYARDIQRAQRRAQRRGEDVPDELLVNMPKAMRDRIRRDRDRLAGNTQDLGADEEGLVYDSFPEDTDTEVDYDIQRILDGLDNESLAVPVQVQSPAQSPGQPRAQASGQRGVHQISDEDDVLADRIDELFAALTDEAEAAIAQPRPSPAPSKPAPAPSKPAPISSKPAQPAPVSSKPAQAAPAQSAPAQAAAPSQPPRPPGPPSRVVGAAPPIAVPDVPARPAAVPGVPARPAAVPDIPARPPAVTDVPARPAAPGRTASATPPGATPARPAPRPETPKPEPSAVPPPPGMTEAETRVLYEQYRQARQLVGGEDISYDRLKRKLNEQAPRLMEQYNAKGLQYDVVVKNDKVVLKATPKATPKRE
jgi:hypothetical protein